MSGNWPKYFAHPVLCCVDPEFLGQVGSGSVKIVPDPDSRPNPTILAQNLHHFCYFVLKNSPIRLCLLINLLRKSLNASKVLLKSYDVHLKLVKYLLGLVFGYRRIRIRKKTFWIYNTMHNILGVGTGNY
jgi:hypothetical protein